MLAHRAAIGMPRSHATNPVTRPIIPYRTNNRCSGGHTPGFSTRCHEAEQPCACRGRAEQRGRYCCSVTEPSLPDIRTPGADAHRRHSGRARARYLPSAQVLAELAPLGPDLRRLAEDLKDRLTPPTDERNDVASSSA